VWVGRLPRRLIAAVFRHRLFSILVAAGIVLRALAWIAFQPALFYGDSYAYLGTSKHLTLNPIRPIGYPLLLHLLLYWNQLSVPAAVQHGFGIVTAIICYALLRQFGAGAVVASIAAAPLLLDGYLLNIEQYLLSESLFMLLLVAGLAVLVWQSRPTVLACTTAGLLLGGAAVTRTVGMVLIAPVLVYCIGRWLGVLRIALVTLGFALPLLAYAAWFDSTYHQFAVTKHDGYFLYGRVSTFAKCSNWNVSPSQKFLCFDQPPSKRPNPNYYVWSEFSRHGTHPHKPFTLDAQLRSFAIAAIVHEPAAYVGMILGDLEHYASPGHWTNKWDTPITQWRFRRAGQVHALREQALVARRGGTVSFNPTIEGLLSTYQAVVFVQGPLLAAAFLAGLIASAVGCARGVRRLRGEALLFSLVGLSLPMTAAATTMFDYRYALPAIPALCLAGGTAAIVATSRWNERRAGPSVPVAEVLERSAPTASDVSAPAVVRAAPGHAGEPT
jgi:hypothetical protein